MMIAVITHNAQFAADQLRREGVLDLWTPSQMKGTFNSGREFIVVTRREQLEGRNITDYRIVGKPDSELIELARARMPK